MSTPKIHRAASLFAGAMTASLVVACGSDASADTCDGAEVSVGIVHSATDALFFIGDKKGYFEDEGLDVTFSTFDSAAKMIPALGSGQLDVGGGAPAAGFYNAVARDIDLRIVADKGSLVSGFDYMSVMVRKDLVDSGQVEEIDDLKGLTVAEPPEATAAASALSAVLDMGGLDYDDVDHQLLPFTEHLSAYENGAIDASVTSEPAATALEQTGSAVRMFDSTEAYNDQQLAVTLYSDGFAKDRPTVAQCFMNGYLRASQDYNTAVADGNWEGPGGDEIVRIVSDGMGMEPATFRKTTPSHIAPDGQLNVDSLQRDYEFFKSRGWIESDVDADFDKLVDTEYIDEAAQSGSQKE